MALCEAFVAYDDGDFAKATDILAPLKYKIIDIGGSDAQVWPLTINTSVVDIIYYMYVLHRPN